MLRLSKVSEHQRFMATTREILTLCKQTMKSKHTSGRYLHRERSKCLITGRSQEEWAWTFFPLSCKGCRNQHQYSDGSTIMNSLRELHYWKNYCLLFRYMAALRKDIRLQRMRNCFPQPELSVLTLKQSAEPTMKQVYGDVYWITGFILTWMHFISGSTIPSRKGATSRGRIFLWMQEKPNRKALKLTPRLELLTTHTYFLKM